MSFRKRKRIIEEESENEDENVENDFDDAPDIPEISEPEISWENFRENMKFQMRKSEIPANQRNTILGGIRPLPSSKNIDAQSFENPFKLWMDTYGDFFFREVLEATNKKAEKLKSNQVSFKLVHFFFDIFIQNIFSIWRKKFLEQHPNLTKLPYRFRQNFQLLFAKQLLKPISSQNQSYQDIYCENISEQPAKKRRKRQNCQTCIDSDVKSKRTFKICQKCQNPICKDHEYTICKSCFHSSSENSHHKNRQ